MTKTLLMARAILVLPFAIVWLIFLALAMYFTSEWLNADEKKQRSSSLSAGANDWSQAGR